MLDNGSAIETANIGSESACGLFAAMFSDFVTSGPPLVASCNAAYLFLGSASEHDCGVKRGTCLEGHPLAHLELQMAYRGCEHRRCLSDFRIVPIRSGPDLDRQNKPHNRNGANQKLSPPGSRIGAGAHRDATGCNHPNFRSSVQEQDYGSDHFPTGHSGKMTAA